jgi:hypothetical protein
MKALLLVAVLAVAFAAMAAARPKPKPHQPSWVDTSAATVAAEKKYAPRP